MYEDLASDPLGVSRRTLEAAGIPWSDPVRRYVEVSSESDARDARGITTVRESRRYFSSWTSQISQEHRRKVEDLTRGSELLRCFERFYPADGR